MRLELQRPLDYPLPKTPQPHDRFAYSYPDHHGVSALVQTKAAGRKKGFVGMMEMLITSINDDIIKPSIGQDSKRYTLPPHPLFLYFY